MLLRRDFDPSNPKTWKYLLTTGEVSQILGISPQTVRAWAKQGNLPGEKHPGSLYFWFRKVEILRYLLRDKNDSERRSLLHPNKVKMVFA